MRGDHFYDKHPSRAMFALFDWDNAFNDWNMGDRHSDLVENDPTKCLVRQRRGRTGYNMLLPVAPELSCIAQVIDPNSGEHFKSNSSLPIELMFRDVPELGEHFEVDTTRPSESSRFRGNKVSFANNVVTGLDPVAFEPFRPIFDFIERTI